MCLGNPFSNQPPMFPPSKKAEEYKNILEYVMIAHIIVIVIKIVLGGFNAGVGDIFSCLILWCGYSRFDYCQTVCYMIMCLQDVFMLSISLGLWLQKNYVNKKGEQELAKKMEKPEDKKKKEEQDADDANKDKYSFLTKDPSQ